jgi:predicted ribosome quality control (RQC) complex YloA/Tae2 family protein
MLMKITLDVTKSLEKNAEVYFEKAKKSKHKLEGAFIALKKTEEKLEKVKEKKIEEKNREKIVNIKKEWYEKFRWFISSEGFLCIGGRDATSNEIVIKKHTDDEDIVFHTSMSGSPFFVIKTKGVKPGEKTLNEVAQATASYSSAWKAGISSAEVFYINPEQVSKTAKPGEFIPRGAFMIYGKKNFINSTLGVAIGIKNGKIIGGPIDAIKENADKLVIVKQGRDKAGPTSKNIKKKLGSGELDDIIRFLPSGGYSL